MFEMFELNRRGVLVILVAIALSFAVEVAVPIAILGAKALAEAPGVRRPNVAVRLLGGEKQVPLPNVKVVIAEEHGSQQKTLGTFTTDEAGWFKAALPVGFYYLHLSSEKEWPFLPFEKFWTDNGQGQSRSLNVRVTEQGVEKWLGGKQREQGFEAATGQQPARVSFTLCPATEFILRAIDVNSGKGLPGVDFYEETALAEDWAHAIYGLNLGSKFLYGSPEVTGPGHLTDKDGNLRRMVADLSDSTKFGVWKAPPGYELIEPRAEVAVITKLGQARAEQVFKFRRIR